MNKWFQWALGIFIALSAIFYIPGKTFNEAHKMLFIIGVPILYIMSLYSFPARIRSHPWLNAILVLALTIFLFSAQKAQLATLDSIVNLFLGIMLFYIFLNYTVNKDFILNALAVIVIANFGMCMLQLLKLDPLCLNDVGQKNEYIVGLFGYKFVLGSYMSILTPLFLFKKRYVIGIMAFVLTCLSLSWAAIGITIVSLLFGLFILYRRSFIRISVIAIIPLLVFLIIVLSNHKANSALQLKIYNRVVFQSQLLEPLFRCPLGQGLGSFKYLDKSYRTYDTLGEIDEAWNDYIQYPIELGFLILLIIFMLYRFELLAFIRKQDKRLLLPEFCALITIPIGMAFHAYFIYPSISVLCLLILAMYNIRKEELL